MDNPPAADVERDVADAAVPAGVDEKHQIAGRQVVHRADRGAVASAELRTGVMREAHAVLPVDVAGEPTTVEAARGARAAISIARAGKAHSIAGDIAAGRDVGQVRAGAGPSTAADAADDHGQRW